jgi:hypothetical protein
LPFRLSFTLEAARQLKQLDQQSSRVRHRKVLKTLGLLERDPRYNGLNSHKYSSISGANGEDVWESYVENRTPSAWRVFWHYGPGDGEIRIVSIAAHPD